MSLTRVTRKGQITLPKDVRETLGIEQSDYVVVVVDGDKAILSPIREEKLADLKGRLPATRPHPGVDDVRRTIGRERGKRGRKPAQ
jgi:AbrB family looped-hinge helix DNA binding protein